MSVARNRRYRRRRHVRNSVLCTFVLLALVLAVRPYGRFGRPA
jgi:hypothetical protein